MLKDITLGQYFPGDSIVHRLDARCKLIAVFVFIVAIFMAVNFASYALMIVVTLGMIAVSHIPPKSIMRGLKPVLIIIIFTAVLNAFFTPGKEIFHVWKIAVTQEGLLRALFMVLRITLLIAGTLLLTYTTAPIALTDGMERLFRPLKVLHVPVHEMAMMMSMALRFIPTLIEETDKIMSAQRARGADFETGSLVRRAKALLPLLVPLFVSAFRRADELATAMESRCYHGGEGRTALHVLRFKGADYLALGLFLALAAAVIALRHFGL